MIDDNGQEAGGAAIAQQLERLARLMRARDHQHGLNPAQREALRYLNRANRFSNSPSALSRYLGATKGTISQTVKALVRKGLLSKSPRPDSGKLVALSLTAKGEAALADDPWLRLAQAISELGGKTRRRMLRGFEELLRAELGREGMISFGTCRSCRFFRTEGNQAEAGKPYCCMHFEAGLTAEDVGRICAAHTPGNYSAAI